MQPVPFSPRSGSPPPPTTNAPLPSPAILPEVRDSAFHHVNLIASSSTTLPDFQLSPQALAETTPPVTTVTVVPNSDSLTTPLPPTPPT